MYTEYMYKDSMAHHGILGMKWGKRNGPPYPLGYEAHSRAEKKLNPKTKIDGKAQTSNNKKSNKQLTDKQKRLLKGAAIGAGIAAAAGLSIYAYKVNPGVRDLVDTTIIRLKGKNLSELNSIENNPFAAQGINYQKSFLKNDGVRTAADIDNDLWISNMGSEANIAYRNHNCFKNAVNMELRARGFDTVAQENKGLGSDNPFNFSENLFKSFKIDEDEYNNITKMMGKKDITPESLFNTLKEQPGSRGIIAARTSANDPRSYHFFNYVVNPDGEIQFLDGYGGAKHPLEAFGTGDSGYLKTEGLIHFRTDNRDLDYKLLADNFVQKNDGSYYSKTKMKKAAKILADIRDKDQDYIDSKYGDLIVNDRITNDVVRPDGTVARLGTVKRGINKNYGLKKSKIR